MEKELVYARKQIRSVVLYGFSYGMASASARRSRLLLLKNYHKTAITTPMEHTWSQNTLIEQSVILFG